MTAYPGSRKSSLKRRKARLFLAAGALLALTLLLVLPVWSWLNSASPGQAALVALAGRPEVAVDKGEWITYTPTGRPAATGFIFYPGGLVPAEAYAPLLVDIAAGGYFVVSPPMPFNLALMAPDRAASIMDAHPEIGRWVIGGHSLGGAMAARYAAHNPDRLAGVVFWAAYPPANGDLSRFDLPVISIYGTQDGLVEPARIERARTQLPETAVFSPIEGGNHAQFGDYGRQEGDLAAGIAADEQHRQIVEATLLFLSQLP